MNDYENAWIYNGKPFDSDQIGDYIGFVYLLENPSTNKKYIGKKLFSSTTTRRVKGKKKRTKKESDWKSYYGSNEHLKQELNEEESHQTVRRTILRLCRTKGECSYYEIKEQLAVDALLKEEYYNNFVGCKIHRKHLP
jgi:hypothetical protein